MHDNGFSDSHVHINGQAWGLSLMLHHNYQKAKSVHVSHTCMCTVMWTKHTLVTLHLVTGPCHCDCHLYGLGSPTYFGAMSYVEVPL